MQFKQKLIYFALGCAFVVIGQVLVTVLTPKVTAQGKKASAEFDTVKVRSLQVVDRSGKVCAILEKKQRDASKIIRDVKVDDVIQVFNHDRVPVYCVGVSKSGGDVGLYNKDGKPNVILIASVFGGYVSVLDNDSKAGAGLSTLFNTGYVSVFGSKNDGGVVNLTQLSASDIGGLIEVFNNDGESRVGIGLSEHGHGAVITWDKNGSRLR